MRDNSFLNKIDAVILCGGPGRRLGAITKDTPKPMAMIGNRPFLEILIRHVSSFGFNRFVLCAGYKKEAIEDHFRTHKGDIEIVFSEEDEGNLLGTAGAIKKAERVIKSDTFLVMNGDSFADIDLGRFLEFHGKKKAVVSIALTRSTKRDDTGLVRLDEGGEITAFSEKKGALNAAYMNIGTYFFNNTVFQHIPPDIRFSLEYDLFPSMVDKGIYGYVVDTEVIDIGTPERLEKAKASLAGGPKT